MFNFKKLKTVSMMLLLWGGGILSNTVTYAEPYNGVSTVGAVLLQNQTCTGIVKDASGEAVIGASVVVKGTLNGVNTDLDGKFVLRGVKKGDVLQVSLLGFKSVEIVFEGKPLEITLEEDTEALEEVVVTALGIKREKKAIGYAVQEVKGDVLLNAHENNLVNAFTGKVSGVQVIRSSNGPAGSSKIQLRGSNSVTGTNQPLIVVDGIPLDNFTGALNNDFWNPSTDMGNGLSDINSEDIESISVLKGASAAALYGTRAGNGVILITTKKGRKSEGLGLTVSFGVQAETMFMIPDRQTSFGQGSEGIYNESSGTNWGPLIEGQTYTDWEGKEQKMKFYNNIKNFFKTGINTTENVTFSQQFGKTAVYISATRLDDVSKIPSSTYSRTNLMSRISSTFGSKDRWVIDAKIQYINSEAHNRPISGQRIDNSFYSIFSMPITLDIRDFKQEKDPKTGNMYWWSPDGLNPYWSAKYNTNNDIRNRLLMNYSLKYLFTDWLDLELKAGSDLYFTEGESKLYIGGPLSDKGRYSFSEDKFYENNFSFLLSAHKDNVLGKFGGNATFGGNLMERKSSGIGTSAGELIVPDLFWIGNSEISKRDISPSYSRRKINSLYGTLGINYDGWIFLDATFRNDWSSTLSKANRSFFYPSVSASWVISDMVNKIGSHMPSWFTYAKLRASFAQVGNDLSPYQLYNTYGVGSVFMTEGLSASFSSGTLYDENVRSELISSWELGGEVRFFEGRLGLDVTWYKSNARRQLLNIPMNSLSGYNSKKINAGNIQNTGVEIMLNAIPVQTMDFRWSTDFNLSFNKNKIIELAEGIEQYPLGGYDNLQIYAQAGGNYGEIWGTTFKRVDDENSPYYGKMILTEEGLPKANPDIKKIGDQQPKCLFGWTNTFGWKGLSFSFLIDARIGGKIFSGSNRLLQANGIAAVTTPGGKRDEFVVDGVIPNNDGGYTPNTAKVTQQQYWRTVTASSGNLGIGEANIYDATNIRLRNISLSYSLPKRLIKKALFQQIKVGFSCNNVWMIMSHLHGVDPESVYATNTNAVGFENASAPTSRTYMFNITLGF